MRLVQADPTQLSYQHVHTQLAQVISLVITGFKLVPQAEGLDDEVRSSRRHPNVMEDVLLDEVIHRYQFRQVNPEDGVQRMLDKCRVYKTSRDLPGLRGILTPWTKYE